MKGVLTIRQVGERLLSYADHLSSIGLEAEADEVDEVASDIACEPREDWAFHADVIDSHRSVDDDEETRDRTDAAVWAYLVACALYDGVQS